MQCKTDRTVKNRLNVQSSLAILNPVTPVFSFSLLIGSHPQPLHQCSLHSFCSFSYHGLLPLARIPLKYWPPQIRFVNSDPLCSWTPHLLSIHTDPKRICWFISSRIFMDMFPQQPAIAVLLPMTTTKTLLKIASMRALPTPTVKHSRSIC